jgi:chaperone required for assembly of F1-ATPase
VHANRAETIAALLRFGENDLLFYRIEAPAELARRQRQWDVYLDWMEGRYGVHLHIGNGVNHVAQSPETLTIFRNIVAPLDVYILAALHVFSSVTGSLILGLAVLEDKLTAAQAFDLSYLDEAYQAEQWGTDHETEERAAYLRREMEQAARLVTLLRA